MDKNALWKWLVTILAIFVSLALVYPPLDARDANGRVTRPGKVRLGLDLRGGSSFLVEVDQQALREEIQRGASDLSPDQLGARVAAETRKAREIALEAIRNRVDGLGVAEPQIFPQMDTRIVIQMPGIDAAKRELARKTIQSVAFLEFRLVHKTSARWVRRLLEEDRAPAGFRWGPDQRRPFLVRDRSAVADEQMDAAFWAELKRFAPHEGCEFMIERDQEADGSTVYRPHYVETAQQLNGKAIQNAMVDYDSLSRPQISLEFNRAGRKRFAQVTRDYAPRGEKNRDSEDGRLLAIILDGTLYSAPEIRTEIPNGRAEITGRFSVTEANRLSNVLRTGSLPVPVRIVEERTVDPTLGRDSIRSGVLASIVSAAAVAAFMVIYYLVAGGVANVALLLDVILFPLGMVLASGFLGLMTRTGGGGAEALSLPTLTLPGIAGIALTFGMAVDANVLIFERMREEQAAGKKIDSIVSAGYQKAFSAIADSNITTLLAAAIMFWKGSGPVRGYAITLSAGILVSMFTAIVVTRLVFNALMRSGRLASLRMLRLLPETKIDFIGLRRPAIGLSLLVIVVSAAVFAARGQKNFGIDFVGGSSVTLKFAQKVPIGDVRAALDGAGVRDAALQYQTQHGTVGGRSEVLVVSVSDVDGDKAADTLTKGFASAGFKVLQKDTVGPQVGSELKRKALVALLLSIVGMVIYISWRFEFGFAVGAIVALAHDAVVAVGLFCLLGGQLSTPMIAVVLTIIGYSVNDTIVIFDRIREDLKLYRGRPYREICNLSINQTLSRTLLTSGTSLLSVAALLLLGGGAIHDFALMLFIGMIAGVYSTVFIATPVMLLWHREPKAAPAKAARDNGKAQPARA